jgi:hypothetical protein
MRFTILLSCWVAFFGWDLTANNGHGVTAFGIWLLHLIHVTRLI